jgi:serine/threonine protein kinase
MDSGSLLAERYRLVRRLASGGMGHVWVARDERLGRDVAVKLQAVGPEEDAASVERFRREALATAALQHPNVVAIYDSGTDDGTAYIVMELLPGPTVADRVAEEGRLPEGLAREIAAQVASGLAAAHAAGIVHRDIKPSNLVFDDHGTVKIVDFGIARLSHAAGAGLTATNTVIGSVAYLSPEQLEGRTADERSDLYALGCVLTTMLTGRAPFQGENPLAIAHQHLNRDPARVLDARPDVDPALALLVDDLLEKDAAGRPASAELVRERLRAPRGTAPQPASEHAARTELLAAPGATRVMSVPARRAPDAARPRPSQHRSRSPWPAIAAVAIVVVTGLVAWSLVSGVDTPASGGTPSAPPTSTSAPNTSDSARPTTEDTTTAPTTSATDDLDAAVAGLDTTVSDAVASGDLDAKKGDELMKKVDDFVKKVTGDRGKDASKQADELDAYVQELVDKDSLSPEAADRIDSAVQQVLSAAGFG